MKKLALGFLATGLIVGMGMANASPCSLAGNAVPISHPNQFADSRVHSF